MSTAYEPLADRPEPEPPPSSLLCAPIASCFLFGRRVKRLAVSLLPKVSVIGVVLATIVAHAFGPHAAGFFATMLVAFQALAWHDAILRAVYPRFALELLAWVVLLAAVPTLLPVLPAKPLLPTLAALLLHVCGPKEGLYEHDAFESFGFSSCNVPGDFVFARAMRSRFDIGCAMLSRNESFASKALRASAKSLGR